MYAENELTAENLERWIAALEDEVDNNRRKHDLVSAQVKAGKVERGAEKRTAELLAGTEAELERVRALGRGGKGAKGAKAAAELEPDEAGKVAVEVPE